MYERRYGDRVPRLTSTVTVTALTPLGERTLTTDKALWDTGATRTVIHAAFANKIGIVPVPPMDGKPLRLDPAAAIDARKEIPNVITSGYFELLDATLPPPVIGRNVRLGKRF